MVKKFNLKPEQLESAWPKIKESVNGKGRSQKNSPQTKRKINGNLNKSINNQKENKENDG